ncbi:hypothetical protein J7643_11070 [bacterium]|nr:hypothetical protein [bacterium]
MARRTIRSNRFRQPVAIAATRQLARPNKLAIAGLGAATVAAAFVSPVLSLGLVGLMLWQAFRAD